MDYVALEAIGSMQGGLASVISLIGILFAITEVRRARKIVDRETDYRVLGTLWWPMASPAPRIIGRVNMASVLASHLPEKC